MENLDMSIATKRAYRKPVLRRLGLLRRLTRFTF
jgi:DNA-binding CsgD family transcriptional regulator